MRGIIFKTVKEGFRKLHRKHKAELKRLKRDPSTAPPVIPMSLKKADFKRKIRGTKFTGAAEFKAQPGLKRRILIGIEKAKRKRKRLGRPVIFGKAYASDKKGKTMQIQPLTFAQRKLMKKEMAESAKRIYARMMTRNKKKGGMTTIKMVKRKLEKASAAHAGQAKALGRVIGKKKMLMGGLLTSGIKAAAKKYFKHGRKTSEIVKKEGGTRAEAKSDVKSGIRDELKGKFQDLDKKFKANKSDELIKMKRRFTIRDMNLLK